MATWGSRQLPLCATVRHAGKTLDSRMNRMSCHSSHGKDAKGPLKVPKKSYLCPDACLRTSCMCWTILRLQAVCHHFFPDQDLSTEPNQWYHFVDFPSHAWDRCASPSRCRALECIQSYSSCQLFTRATNQSCSGCSVADVAASQRILHAEKALYTLYNFSIPGMITFTS